MNRRIFSLLFSCVMLAAACSGGGGDGGGGGAANTFTIAGTVSVPAGQQASPAFKAFQNTALDGAHVNVCTVQNGTLAALPGHPTVLADSSGAFTISVDRNDVPQNRQMWVCAKPPASGGYTVLAPIPQNLLPADLTQVSTVTVNPDTNTTIITRYACGQSIMFFNGNKCLATDEGELQALNSAIDQFSGANPGVTPDLSDLNALLSTFATDTAARAVLEAWLSEVPQVAYDDFITDAQTFSNPVLPLPSGGGASAGVSGLACNLSPAGDGITEATISAAGSAGGGNLDVFTVFFTFDGSTLFDPDSLGCGNWQRSGGLATCTKLSVSADMTSFIGTSSVLFSTGFEPVSVTVQVKGFQSGSPTVLASDELTVPCQ